MGDAPSSTTDVIERHCHRSPLPQDIVQCIAKVITQLESALGPARARATPQHATLLKLLRAHTRPLPQIDTPFMHFQGQRLRVFTKSHIEAARQLPLQLVLAIRDGRVPEYPPECLLQLPVGLVPPNVDLSGLNSEHVEIEWEERRLPIDRTRITSSRMPLLDPAHLAEIRDSTVRRNMSAAQADIRGMLDAHYDGDTVLDRHTVLLLEARIRHIQLWERQRDLRTAIWKENVWAERDGRRGSKARFRVLKNLRKEYHKVERVRIRREELEERERRKMASMYLGALNEHTTQFKQYHRDVVRRGVRFMVKAVTKYHEEVSRHASRAEREAEKARIQKLREDDEEGYLELLKQTKNERLTELLDQTDRHLRQLGSLVKEERAKSGVVEYEMKDSSAEPAKRAYFETAHAIKEKIEEQPRMLVGGTLKGYQLQGIQWMVSLYNNRLNGILADEMGLGKTIQTIGLIAYLMEVKHNPGPFLVVVPLSTMSNWELEFANWSPSIRTVTFKGDKKKRKKIYESIIATNQFNVCLVTYEYVVQGKNFLKKLHWEHIIIDEGQRLKNHESKLAVTLSKQYTSRSRLLLTGTPLQNSLTELWALLNFLLPTIFNSSESFESWFAAPFSNIVAGDNAPQESSAQLTEEESLLIIRRLHQVLRPFLLRRLKADVLRQGEQLPTKSEHIIMCDMSEWQKYTYYKIAKQQKILYADSRGKLRYGSLPNPAMQLKKCCNHPFLFFSSNPEYNLDGMTLLRSSGKFGLLDSVLTKLLRTKHRVLIFNQMKKVVHLQERLLEFRNIPYLKLDGSTSPDERKRMVAEFNSSDTSFDVFLLTTRAGGLGVNLQTADTVIIFDSDWNPQVDLQAQDRAHRIGQRREVLVFRFLTAKSVEEMIIERATYKRGLEQKIIQAGMFDENAKDSERQALLRELLRIEEAESEGDDGDSNVPTDEEINQLLSRSKDEEIIFAKIDEERARELGNRPILATKEEIPDYVTDVPEDLLNATKGRSYGIGINSNTFDEVLKPRRASQGVSYGVDRLTDAQYIQMMERQAQGLSPTLNNDEKRGRKGRKKRSVEVTERTSSAIDEEFFGIGRDDDALLQESKENIAVGMKNIGAQTSVDAIVIEENVAAKTVDSKMLSDSALLGRDGSGQKRVLDTKIGEPRRKKTRLVIEDDDESEFETSYGDDEESKMTANGLHPTMGRESSAAVDTEDPDMEEEDEREDDENEESDEESEELKGNGVEDGEEEEGEEGNNPYDGEHNIAQDIGIQGIELDDQEEGQILATVNGEGDDYIHESFRGEGMSMGDVEDVDDGEIREDGELSDQNDKLAHPVHQNNPAAFVAAKGIITDKSHTRLKPPPINIDVGRNYDRREKALPAPLANGVYADPIPEEEGEIVEDGEIADDDENQIASSKMLENDTEKWSRHTNGTVLTSKDGSKRQAGKTLDARVGSLSKSGLSSYDSQEYGVDEGEIAEAAPQSLKANGPNNIA